MENAPKIIAGRKEHSIDSKGRTVIDAVFRRQFDRANKLFLLKDRVACYPVLEIKSSLRTDFTAMSEEERLREYSAFTLTVDRQGRIEIPEEPLKYLFNSRETPKTVLQAGWGDRMYIWYPEDFREYERKSLESPRTL